jgi:hypothetical protein
VEDNAYHARRRQLIGAWTDDSRSRLSVLLKLAVSTEFSVSGIAFTRSSYRFARSEIDGLGPTVRQMYLDTQEALSDRGIIELHLYRGIAAPYEVRSVLTSFTSSIRIARRFGRYGVLKESIPSTRVFAWHQGPGWVNGRFGEQLEYVVLSEAPG